MTELSPSRLNSRSDRWHRVPALALALILLVTPLAMAYGSAGPATETIYGTVFDERGVPHEGVLVLLMGTQVSATTDGEGAFTISDPDLDGSHALKFNKVGYLTATKEYTLGEGGTLDLSVYLVEEEVVPGSVIGTVVSFTGDPIEGALAILDLIDDPSMTAVTNDEGHYFIGDVPPSDTSYTMTIEAPGHNTQTIVVTVLTGLASVVDVTLAPETPMELIRGRVLDSRHLPLPGVTVTIDGSQAEWTTDLEGRFSALLDGRFGTRDVSLTLEGYMDLIVPVAIPDPGLAEVDMALTLDGTGGPETLWVRVVSEWTGDPVAGVEITIDGSDVEGTTDSGGVAILTGAELEGTVTVMAAKPSHTSSTAEFILLDGGTGVVTLRITRASNAVTLTGRVQEAGSGEAVTDAPVAMNSGGIVWTTRTDMEGMFQVHNLPPGVTTLVTVFAEGFVLAEIETVLLEYETNHLIISLEKEIPTVVSVYGTVTNGTHPVADARVTLWNDVGFMAVAHTDAEGAFLFQGVPVVEGLTTYKVEHPSYMKTENTLLLPQMGGRITLDVTLKISSRTQTVIQGWVRGPDGFAIDGARVSFVYKDTEGTTITTDGHYTLMFLGVRSTKPISIDVSASAEGYGHHSRNAIISAQVNNWVNLTLPLGAAHGNVLGTVRIAGDKPLEGAEVQLSMGGAYRQMTTTALDGSYAFHLVPANDQPYQLSVVAEGYNGVIVDATSIAGRTTWYNLEVEEDVTSVETIIGTVTNNEGLPVANAVVRIGGAWNVVTDANGTYILVGEDLEGRWSVSASISGFENSYKIAVVPSGGTVVVDLVLDVMDAKATTVGGMVLRGSSGKPLEGANVRLARSASNTWTFETTSAADGTFEFRGVPLDWDAVAVTVTFPGYIDDVARELLSDSEIAQLEFYMQKEVLPEPAEPMISGSEARQVGAGVSITVGALIIIFMTEVGRVALLGLILVPLYTKIKREKVMDHFVRGRIYEFVCQNPGVNYSAIKEQFKLTNGTVTYHLSMLERQEFIRAKQDGIYKRYFSNNGGPAASEVEPMSLQLNIAKAIRERPGMTQKELAKHLGSSKQLVSYHIRRMKKDGQLETRRDGRSVRVFANHLTPE
jgi:predicted transcriptional regulator